MLKIAHISDLHLWKWYFHWSQFFSKRWLGNLNMLLFRKRSYKKDQIFQLVDIFKELKLDYLIVSGDISSTSLEDEFKMGREFFDKIKDVKILFLPGNHDNYTKEAQKDKLFYKYFENQGSKYSLKEDKVEIHQMKDGWWYLGIDCTLATNLLSSRGLFSKKIEKNINRAIEAIPKGDAIIFANHYPFRSDKLRKGLIGKERLKRLLKNHPNIKIYLQGHTHKHKIQDLRKYNLPLILDSGSIAHNTLGRWNLLEIQERTCKISVYGWKGGWKKNSEKQVDFHVV